MYYSCHQSDYRERCVHIEKLKGLPSLIAPGDPGRYIRDLLDTIRFDISDLEIRNKAIELLEEAFFRSEEEAQQIFFEGVVIAMENIRPELKTFALRYFKPEVIFKKYNYFLPFSRYYKVKPWDMKTMVDAILGLVRGEGISGDVIDTFIRVANTSKIHESIRYTATYVLAAIAKGGVWNRSHGIELRVPLTTSLLKTNTKAIRNPIYYSHFRNRMVKDLAKISPSDLADLIIDEESLKVVLTACYYAQLPVVFLEEKKTLGIINGDGVYYPKSFKIAIDDLKKLTAHLFHFSFESEVSSHDSVLEHGTALDKQRSLKQVSCHPNSDREFLNSPLKKESREPKLRKASIRNPKVHEQQAASSKDVATEFAMDESIVDQEIEFAKLMSFVDFASSSRISDKHFQQKSSVQVAASSKDVNPQAACEGSFLYEGKQYKILKTLGDGACALHALLGKVYEGSYKWKNARERISIFLLEAFNNKSREFLDDFFDIMKDHLEYSNVFDSQKEAWENLNKEKEKKLNALKEEEANLWLPEINKSNSFLFIKFMAEVRKIKDESNLFHKKSNREVLDIINRNKQAFMSRIDENYGVYIENVNGSNRIRAIREKRERTLKTHDKAQKEFLCSKEVFNHYLDAIKDQGFWFNTHEMELFAKLFNKKVTIFNINSQNGERSAQLVSKVNENGQESDIYIVHKEGHFSRCHKVS